MLYTHTGIRKIYGTLYTIPYYVCTCILSYRLISPSPPSPPLSLSHPPPHPVGSTTHTTPITTTADADNIHSLTLTHSHLSPIFIYVAATVGHFIYICINFQFPDAQEISYFLYQYHHYQLKQIMKLCENYIIFV